MNGEIFERLKKLAKHEGRVVLVDKDEAFILMSLDEYEMLLEDNICDCGCEDEDMEEPEEVEIKDDSGIGSDDKELLRKVNEDIAKWRAEQNEKEGIKTETPEEKEPENDEKNGGLEDEERYYLEPLE